MFIVRNAVAKKSQTGSMNQTVKSKQSYTIDDVERLSRGQRTAKRIGSRAVGHHLSRFERNQYDLANKHGFMTLNNRSRENLWNIWQKACLARGWPCVILSKKLGQNLGQVFQEGEVVFQGELKQAKLHARSLVESYAKT